MRQRGYNVEKISNGIFSEQTLASLQQVVEDILGKDKATVTIRNRQTGELLYTYRGNHLMRPASNMKILTGATALDVLGKDYRFYTEIYIDGELENGQLNGNVYIKGHGDPTISADDLLNFANVLKQHGIEKINGQLLADETHFTGDTLPPGVDDEGETHYYGARVSPITMSPNSDYDASTIVVTAVPTIIGQPPTFEGIPDLCGMKIINKALTVAIGEENTLEIRRTNGTDKIVILGNLPQDENAKVWVSMQDPALNTLTLLKTLCEQQGIQFLNSKSVAKALVQKDAKKIHTHASQTIEEMFSIYMKLSNNSIADIFAKTFGKLTYGVGNYEAGARVIRDYLQQQKIDFSAWQFVDGSGLSHGIRLSSNGISKLLFELQKEPYFDIFFDSLPIGGNTNREIGGTLKDRFLEPELANRIFAKTGYIHEVNTLSGYMTADSGENYIFSIMLEGLDEGIPFLDAGLKKILTLL